MKYLNKNFSRMTILSLVAIMALLLTSSLAFAQEEARVYLQPVESAEGSLTVDVVAENVTNMYGAEFRLRYDPAMVSVQDLKADQDGIQIQAGSLLPADQGFVVANEVNETEGTIIFAMTLLNPAPPVSGSGPLARVTFDMLQRGSSTIDVEHAKLVAIDLQTIPSRTETLAIGSDEQTATTDSATTETSPSVADSNFPWWIVAAAVMVLGILALGGFIMMGGLNSKSTAPITQEATKSNRQPTPPMGGTSTRPSAFKNQVLSSVDLTQKPRQPRR